MKAIIVAAIAAVLLSGCVTYGGMKNRSPIHQASSSKAPDVVAQCVLPQWLEASTAAHIVQDGAVTTVVVPIGTFIPARVSMILEVTPTATGSHVEMRKMPSLASFDKYWADVQRCL